MTVPPTSRNAPGTTAVGNRPTSRQLLRAACKPALASPAHVALAKAIACACSTMATLARLAPVDMGERGWGTPCLYPDADRGLLGALESGLRPVRGDAARVDRALKEMDGVSAGSAPSVRDPGELLDGGCVDRGAEATECAEGNVMPESELRRIDL